MSYPPNSLALMFDNTREMFYIFPIDQNILLYEDFNSKFRTCNFNFHYSYILGDERVYAFTFNNNLLESVSEFLNSQDITCRTCEFTQEDYQKYKRQFIKSVIDATVSLGLKKDNIAEFYSNAKILYPLSNFHLAPITISEQHIPDEIDALFPTLRTWLKSGKTFNSSEHLWQSLKSANYETFIKFTSDGAFGNRDPLNFFKMINEKTAQSKVDYWMKKQNIGIVPKMAVNKANVKKLGLKQTDLTFKEYYASQDEEIIWLFILKQKFVQNPILSQLLVSTGNKYLLEFDRGAKNKPTHWGGLVENEILNGKNVMGIYLSKIRDIIKTRKTEHLGNL